MSTFYTGKVLLDHPACFSLSFLSFCRPPFLSPSFSVSLLPPLSPFLKFLYFFRQVKWATLAPSLGIPRKLIIMKCKWCLNLFVFFYYLHFFLRHFKISFPYSVSNIISINFLFLMSAFPIKNNAKWYCFSYIMRGWTPFQGLRYSPLLLFYKSFFF